MVEDGNEFFLVFWILAMDPHEEDVGQTEVRFRGSVFLRSGLIELRHRLQENEGPQYHQWQPVEEQVEGVREI